MHEQRAELIQQALDRGWRGWTAEGGYGFARSAQISSWTRQPVTRTQAGGDLRFYTTPLDSASGQLRMVIEPSGGITIRDATSTPHPPQAGSVVLYVKDGQLEQMDASGESTPLANQPTPAPVTVVEHHEQTTQVPAPPATDDPRVASLQRMVSSLKRQVRDLKRVVSRMRRR